MRGIDPNLALVMFFVLACLGFMVLPACTPTATVQHTAPQLDAASDSIRKTSDSIRLAVDKMAAPQAQCQKLDMPPIMPDVVLDIKGDKITANEGGEILLRWYVRARKLLKPAAQLSSTPTATP